MAIKTYDPKEVAVVFNASLITGYADGDFISISFEDDQFEHMSGADGEEMRTKRNDYRATLTLTLLQSSASNDVLSAIFLADRAGSDAAYPLIIKDNSGRTLVTAESAWIRKPADVTFGKSGGTREWNISLSNAQWFIGGQTSI